MKYTLALALIFISSQVQAQYYNGQTYYGDPGFNSGPWFYPYYNGQADAKMDKMRQDIEQMRRDNEYSKRQY